MKKNSFFDKAIFFIVTVCCSQIASAQQAADYQYALHKANTSKAKADICFSLSRKYADGLKIDSALHFAEQIKEFSQRENYQTGFGKYHLARAIAFHYRGRESASMDECKQAIEVFTKQNEYAFLGIAFWQLGFSQHSIGETERSRKNFWTSAHFLTSSRDDLNLFRTYYLLGRSYAATSDYDSSASYFFKALLLAEKNNDDYKIFSAATELGEAFLNLRNLPKANQYLSYGLNYRTPASKITGWLKLASYAVNLSLLHQFIKADSVIAEFEKLAATFDNAWGSVTLDKLKGIQEYEKGNYQNALKYLRHAYARIDQIEGFNLNIKEIILSLGKTEFKIKSYDSAVVHLAHAAQLSRSLKSFVDAIEADLLLSESFQKNNMPDSALHYFRRYSALKDSVLTLEKGKLLTEVTARYESEKKEQLIKMLEKETEANSYLLQLRHQEIEKQKLENDYKSQQLDLALKQNEINKLDASQKALSLDNEKKENEKKLEKLKLLENEASFQKLLAAKQNQQKNIAWASIGVMVLLGGYFSYRFVRKKRMQNQQEVLNERLRISRELHDELGSTLSGIAMYGYLTKAQFKSASTEEVERSLDRIQQSAGEMVGKLSDIVWLVNPEKDSFQKLIERLEEFAVSMAMAKGIALKFTFPESLNHINLSVECRRNIYLFCKEAINNAVKYSDANLIELAIKEIDHKKITVLVTDNGKGFDPATVKRGNGLVSMQERAETIKGSFSLDTRLGQGTTVSLTCKIT